MSKVEAAVWLDHRQARVLRLGDDETQVAKVAPWHHHDTGKHHGDVREDHEFFGRVCDGLDGLDHVLLTGPHRAIEDFRRYVGKHRPAVAPRLIGTEVVDHPTDGQLAALARRFFAKWNTMN